VGSRGSGKTVLMTKIANEAVQTGWISANVTADDNLLQNILTRTQRAAEGFDISSDAKSRITGIKVGGFGLKREFVDPSQVDWRSDMEDILDVLEQESVGLLITIDEVQICDAMRNLVTTFQHFVREERQVALLMAGLPQNIQSLLTDKSISFLRRAAQHHLGSIHEDHEVKEVMEKTILLSGRSIGAPALDMAAKATGGFPFLIQLIGFHIWRQNPNQAEITEADTVKGIDYARADMDVRIIKVTLDELSDGDLQFLMAMTQDTGDSQVKDIADRLGRDANYTNQYRLRLIEQGIIRSNGRGRVTFEMPMLKSYLTRNYPVE
jgi:hypothetical protein